MYNINTEIPHKCVSISHYIHGMHKFFHQQLKVVCYAVYTRKNKGKKLLWNCWMTLVRDYGNIQE